MFKRKGSKCEIEKKVINGSLMEEHVMQLKTAYKSILILEIHLLAL